MTPEQSTIGGVVLGDVDIQSIFRDPAATLETTEVVSYGKDVFALRSGGNTLVLRPLPKGFTRDRCIGVSKALAQFYNSEYIAFRPGEPRFFSVPSVKGGQKEIMSLSYVEGDIILETEQFLTMGDDFKRGVLRGLAQGERQLTDFCGESALLAGMLPPRWPFSGIATPVALRILWLVAIRNHLHIIPQHLLSEVAEAGIVSVEMALAKGHYFRQGNCELFVGRPGALLQDGKLVLLEFEHAGEVPYPGQDVVKIVGRAMLPSSPKHNCGDLQGCLDLASKAATTLIEVWGDRLDESTIVNSFGVLLFLQLVESYTDNRWHVEQYAKRKVEKKQNEPAEEALDDRYSKEALDSRFRTAFAVYREIFHYGQ